MQNIVNNGVDNNRVIDTAYFIDIMEVDDFLQAQITTAF
jgi:hypothetical protein